MKHSLITLLFASLLVSTAVMTASAYGSPPTSETIRRASSRTVTPLALKPGTLILDDSYNASLIGSHITVTQERAGLTLRGSMSFDGYTQVWSAVVDRSVPHTSNEFEANGKLEVLYGLGNEFRTFTVCKYAMKFYFRYFPSAERFKVYYSAPTSVPVSLNRDGSCQLVRHGHHSNIFFNQVAH